MTTGEACGVDAGFVSRVSSTQQDWGLIDETAVSTNMVRLNGRS